ncbi:MAG: helix-turn-helix transcriptional regulator [Candidatus Hodarchaeales archaeon]|jgi:flagellar biosynthesis/type III secretory pathway M-ring protein FliF/YscJ
MSWTIIISLKSILSPLQEMPHEMTSNSATNDPLIILFLAIISILLILLTVFVIIFLYRYNRDQRQKEDVKAGRDEQNQNENPDKIRKGVFTRPSQWEILSLEEQAVIDLLVQNEGNLLQKDVPLQTNFSKSTVTRILSRLEDQDIVYRSPAGRGYRIFLKELEAL